MPSPEFVIKAKDVLAVVVLEFYEQKCRELGLHSQANQVKAARQEMFSWREENPEEVKAPTHLHQPFLGEA